MISIIIPTYNEGAYLGATLRNLSDNLTDVAYEVIVVDGGSHDGTIETIERYKAQLVAMGRSTIAKARNVGAEHAKGDYLVFFDADVIIPDPNHFFKKAFSDFARHKTLVGLSVFLKTTPAYDRPADHFFRGFMNYFHFVNNNILHQGSGSEFFMIPAKAFWAVGGFNVNLVVAEDNDLFWRLHKTGRTMIDRSLTVFHTERRAHTIGWLKLYAIWTKNSLAWALFKNKGASKEWTPIR